MKRIALGRGLDALLPAAVEKENKEIINIDITQIKPNSYQPRRHFNEEKIAELAESIRHKGMIQPVVVRKDEDQYELIVGERRLRAARFLELDVIPAVVYDNVTRRDMMEMALIENIQREDLNPIDQASAYQVLLQECNLSQEELASRVGKDRSSIANSLRLLTLPGKISDMVIVGNLSAGAARVILAVPGEMQKIELADRAVKEGLSVRELEKIVYGDAASRKSRRVKVKSPLLLSIEEKLKNRLETKVNIAPRRKGGRIIIEYYNNDGLTRILEYLQVTDNL